MRALASISAISVASPHGFRTDASVLLQVGTSHKGNTSHICLLNPTVKTFPDPQKSSSHISLGRAGHMTGHMPASAARDAGKGRTWVLPGKERVTRKWLLGW